MSNQKDYSVSTGLSQSTPLFTSGRKSPELLPNVRARAENFFERLKLQLAVVQKDNDNINDADQNKLCNKEIKITFNEDEAISLNAALISELKKIPEKLNLERNESITFSCSANENSISLKANIKNKNYTTGLVGRFSDALFNGKNEKQEKNEADKKQREERNTIKPERKEIFNSVVKKVFAEFYQKMEEVYDFNVNNSDCKFSVSLPELTPDEYRIFLDALKAARSGIQCFSKDENQTQNIMDFTRNEKAQTIDVSLKNLVPEIQKIDFSLFKNFCKKLNINFEEVHDKPTSKLAEFRQELRAVFQEQLKLAYPKLHKKILNACDLVEFESELGAKSVSTDMSLPLEKFQTDEEKAAFVNNMKKFADAINNKPESDSTCSVIKADNCIQLSFDKTALSDLSPEMILKSYQEYKSVSPQTMSKWVDRISSNGRSLNASDNDLPINPKISEAEVSSANVPPIAGDDSSYLAIFAMDDLDVLSTANSASASGPGAHVRSISSSPSARSSSSSRTSSSGNGGHLKL
ncbi:MAG: hypothetical protein K0R98_104 [Rickettsiaceae bacterium]|jgi:hypothetical protein|nr:hypothetical protein [Rickettsiaceae bacterium]